MSSRPELKLAWCSHEAAKYACRHWHYSKTIPTSKLVKIGAWENDRFIGAIVFGVGASNVLLRRYGLTPQDGCELVRIALQKHHTPVSRIVSIALKMLKKHSPNLRLVISFADPEQGHAGAIYQAMNWIYTGTSEQADEYIVNGKRWHGRSLRHNKPPHMTAAQYAKQLDPAYKYLRGSRKHRYLYPLDNETRDRIIPLAMQYPRRASEAGDDPTKGTAAVQH